MLLVVVGHAKGRFVFSSVTLILVHDSELLTWGTGSIVWRCLLLNPKHGKEEGKQQFLESLFQVSLTLESYLTDHPVSPLHLTLSHHIVWLLRHHSNGMKSFIQWKAFKDSFDLEYGIIESCFFLNLPPALTSLSFQRHIRKKNEQRILLLVDLMTFSIA